MATLKEAQKKLQEDFILLRKINNDLINDLTEYSTKNGLMDIIFIQNLTFKQSIDVLKSVKEQAMADENFESISKSESLEAINGVSKNIDTQIRHHKEVRDVFDALLHTN